MHSLDAELTLEHSITPIINLKSVNEIPIVRTTPGPTLNKVHYYCPPKILTFLVLLRYLVS